MTLVDLSLLEPNSLGVHTKEWGREIWLENQKDYCAKILDLKANYQCSKHSHPIKKETFIILSGEVTVEQWMGGSYWIGDFGPGFRTCILPGTFHRFSSKVGATILEVSTFHSNDDVVRLEPSGPIP